MTKPDATRLALLGGKPVRPETLTCPPWPPIQEATAQRLAEVYRSGAWSFNGPEEKAFAQAFAEYHGATHGIMMANGTVTLECALAVCGVGPGDEVIVPALTWLATAMAVHYVGATPVFVDIEPTTFCLDPQKVRQALTEHTRAIIPVHIYSSMADMEALGRIAADNGLTIIEDCAHAHGGKWAGRGVGSWSSVGSFSFQQSKTLTCGEGGICITSDDGLAEKLMRRKHIGYAPGMAQGQADSGPPAGLICRNYRTTEFQAAILRDQLAELPERIETYNRNAARLTERLADVPSVRVQSPGRLADPQGYYTWMLAFDPEAIADVPLSRLCEAFLAEGLPVVQTYGVVYRHVLYNMPEEDYRIAAGGCPVAEQMTQRQIVGLIHQWLSADAGTLDAIGEIIEKVAGNLLALAAAGAEEHA